MKEQYQKPNCTAIQTEHIGLLMTSASDADTNTNKVVVNNTYDNEHFEIPITDEEESQDGGRAKPWGVDDMWGGDMWNTD